MLVDQHLSTQLADKHYICANNKAIDSPMVIDLADTFLILIIGNMATARYNKIQRHPSGSLYCTAAKTINKIVMDKWISFLNIIIIG